MRSGGRMTRRAPRSRVLALVVGALLCLQWGWAGGAQAAGGTVFAGGATYPLAGTDIVRAADQLVSYTYQPGQTSSPANRWGAEAAVKDGIVTKISDRQATGAAGMPIPVGGSVLSGHGAARLWLLAQVHVGQVVWYPGSGSPLAAGSTVVTMDASSMALTGTDVARAADALVRYTATSGTVSPANQWGAEAGIANGKVTSIVDRQSTGAPPAAIPGGGYVLSGHGTARIWLLAHAKIGRSVGLTVSTGAQPVPHTGSCQAGRVRLTFDDGPDAMVTPQVLDTLRAWKVKATFFVVGVSVVKSPALVAQEAREGHAVGNHTWDHPYLTTLAPDLQRSELVQTQDAVAAAGAPRPLLWRPPYEDWNPAVRDLATSLGLSMTLWNYETDSDDWMGLSSQAIINRLVANARDGDIVLMHDRIQNTATALPMILDGLLNKGLCAGL